MLESFNDDETSKFARNYKLDRRHAFVDKMQIKIRINFIFLFIFTSKGNFLSVYIVVTIIPLIAVIFVSEYGNLKGYRYRESEKETEGARDDRNWMLLERGCIENKLKRVRPNVQTQM